MFYWISWSATVLIILLLILILLKNRIIIHKSKKYLIIALGVMLISAILLMLTVVPYKNNTASSTIVVGYAIKAPFIFYNTEHQLTGLEVHLIKSIFQNKGYKLVWNAYNKQDLPKLLKEQKIDIAIAGFTSKHTLSNNILSSDVYLQSHLMFFANDKYAQSLKAEMESENKSLLQLLSDKHYLVGMLYDDEINNFTQYITELSLRTQSLDTFNFITASMNADYFKLGLVDAVTLEFYKKYGHTVIQALPINQTLAINFVILSRQADLVQKINTYLQQQNNATIPDESETKV